jgi:hypothetical protein
MSTYKAQFRKVHKKLLEAAQDYKTPIAIDDFLMGVMQELYPEETETISINTLEWIDDNPPEYCWVSIPAIFDIVENKKQFISDFELALAVAPKLRDLKKIVEHVKKSR